MQDDDLLRDAQVAKMLNITVSTLRSWRHRKQGPAVVRMSRRAPRYLRSDVEAFIASRREVFGAAE